MAQLITGITDKQAQVIDSRYDDGSLGEGNGALYQDSSGQTFVDNTDENYAEFKRKFTTFYGNKIDGLRDTAPGIAELYDYVDSTAPAGSAGGGEDTAPPPLPPPFVFILLAIQ